MDIWLANHGDALRLVIFILLVTCLPLLEWFFPRRVQKIARVQRWLPHLLLMVLNTGLLKLLLPFMAVGCAVIVHQRGWGLFNLLELPYWIEFGAALVLLDLAIYWQHRLLHRVPMLWRLHRVHHTDKELDASSALRFHPLEMLLSMMIKMLLVALLGPPVAAVVLFEVLLSSMALFTHANVKLPERVDHCLRAFMITPDMHRIHHSNRRVEIDSNYGFCLSFWDRLFGSYTENPNNGQLGMIIGIPGVDIERATKVTKLLYEPIERS